MGNPELRVLISRGNHAVSVTLAGEARFDFDAADEYIQSIVAYEPKTVVVDATELSYVSSVGMCFLLNLRRAVRTQGGSLTLHGLQPVLQKVLKHAHVLHLFELTPAAATIPAGSAAAR